VIKILHLDLETFPHQVLSWGLFNQNISTNQILKPGYTLCFAAKWHHDKEIIFKSGHHDGHSEMVKQAWYLLDEADVVTSWNGQRFDLPILQKDFLLEGLGPTSPFAQVDLLKTSRRQFRLASNKLDYVAQQLGLGTKVQHKGMDLWKECEQGNEESWTTMRSYNIHDVVLLERVYNRLMPWIKGHPNHALYTDSEKPVCRNCGSSNVHSRGVQHTNTLSYRRYYCNACGTWMRGKNNITDKEKTVLV